VERFATSGLLSKRQLPIDAPLSIIIRQCLARQIKKGWS
jgi:hypothetical protein